MGLGPQNRIPANFRGASADYGAKSSEGIFYQTASTWREEEITLQLSLRTLHSLECLRTIRSCSVCLFLRQPKGPRCNVPSCNFLFPNFRKRCILQTQMNNVDMPRPL